ncbi:hypothetical protein V5O48_010186 [Marasmius crinis-equi]|uniref:Uncharacterized protein n=1 Tax=Marasmius crinis-equi TaxID=585013 RepID=A0ABR3F939_9AGAR
MPRLKQLFTRDQKQEAARIASAKYYQKYLEPVLCPSELSNNALLLNRHKADVAFRRQLHRKEKEREKNRKTERKKRKNNARRQKERDRLQEKEEEKVSQRAKKRQRKYSSYTWKYKADQLENRILLQYGKEENYKIFCQNVIAQFLADEDTNKLDRLHQQFEGYVSTYRSYQQDILNDLGAGEVYDYVQNKIADVGITVIALADIYCEALLGVDHIANHARKSRFDFQR